MRTERADTREFRAPCSGLILGVAQKYGKYHLHFVQDSEIHMLSGRPLLAPTVLDPSDGAARRDPISPNLRKHVFNRGKMMCMCCGGTLMLTMQAAIRYNAAHAPHGQFVQVMHCAHGMAHSKGGPAILENLFACCASTYSYQPALICVFPWMSHNMLHFAGCSCCMGLKTPFEFAKIYLPMLVNLDRPNKSGKRYNGAVSLAFIQAEWWTQLETSFVEWRTEFGHWMQGA